MLGYSVKEIKSKDAHPFLLNKHYAGRIPSISWCYGLFNNVDALVGVLTLGKPASNSLCVGICGHEYSKYVYELNRLCIDDGLEKNVLSFFVGSVLRKFKNTPYVFVSYADSGMHHNGYIYQATNWLYTGKTKARTDKYVPIGKHSRHYIDSDNHLRILRTSKHRYVWFCDKKMETLLKYPISSYPKGTNQKYVLGEKQKRCVINTKDDTIFIE